MNQSYNKFIEELSWRGILFNITEGAKEMLSKKMTIGYIGFDPTADSLHIGNLVPIIVLKHFQQSGHKPIALVGGATGMIGDPSGKAAERILLNEHDLNKNIEGIKKQLTQLLDFNSPQPNAALLLNNYDWFKHIAFIDFLRDTGKHITVNYMMAKDSVKKRIQSETGISYTEFAYQLMQGYDFYHLFVQYQCALQMGGSDQWGNMITGIELIRKKCGGEASVLTCPLITKHDGSKFGKTEKGNIWLDPEKTSPFYFYQFWLNSSDEDAIKWIKIFTFLDEPSIEAIIKEHQQDPSKRVLQKKLASEVTQFIHGEDALHKALQATISLFDNKQKSIVDMTFEEIRQIEGIKEINITSSATSKTNGDKFHPHYYPNLDTIDTSSLLVKEEIFNSKSEVRKMIQNGGLKINREKITEANTPIKDYYIKVKNNDPIEAICLVQKGKKDFYLIKYYK